MKKYLQKLDTLGLLLLVAAAIWYSVSDVWGRWNVGLAIAGLVFLVAGVAANYKQIIGSLGKRSTRYAGNYVISLILVIAIVSGLNYIGQKHPKRIDTTGSGRYTLAPQTTQILEKLQKDVQIKAFYPGGEHARLKDLLLQFRTGSSHVRFEFIDPDRQPDVAKQNEVTAYGTIQNPFTGSTIKFGTVIVSQGDKREKIEKREDIQEEDLTNAIIKVQQTEAKKIYFVQGHGEKDPEDTERPGYAEAKKALESQGYIVDSVNLATQGKVPDDAKVLILAGSKTQPFPQEMQFINTFLNEGGSLLIMADPHPAPSFEPFLKDWGVKVNDDVVLDVSGAGRLMGTGPEVPIVIQYETHKITDALRGTMTFFPFTRSLEPVTETSGGVTVEPLFKTNPNSWGETDLSSQNASYDPTRDRKGPLTLALAVTKDIKSSSGNSGKARMVVTGTSTFSVNAYFPTLGNGNMFLNMVSWLAQDEDLISIRPKEEEDRRILLSQSQLSLVRLITVFALPAAALVIGIAVVVNRRRK